jgi:hypothetical protein
MEIGFGKLWKHFVIFEVITATIMMFWVLATRRLPGRCQSFGETHRDVYFIMLSKKISSETYVETL